MIIQYNTDKTITGDERNEDYFTSLISKELDRFQSHLTRVEVHLKDENGKKDGFQDIRCLIEARMEGKPPIAVSNQADTVSNAVSGAIDKLKSSLETIIGRIKTR
ncbi:Sigma 54 modulation protein / S30EA ribosomal protein [Spirosomataceae bacterium TFI 002]|nr:Sigma 54 modulation protein / S30EA ribosomal protein [Spirosomataceae bacterium TFI 002]